MGFTLSNEMMKKVSELALEMGESEEATIIPDSEGQVLVRQGTRAFLERKNIQEIFKAPIRLKTVIKGEGTEDLFFVCTS